MRTLNISECEINTYNTFNTPSWCTKNNKYANPYSSVLRTTVCYREIVNHPLSYSTAVFYMKNHMEENPIAWQLLYCDSVYYCDNWLEDFAKMYGEIVQNCACEKTTAQLKKLYALIVYGFEIEDHSAACILEM